jgi:hypothetical protein
MSRPIRVHHSAIHILVPRCRTTSAVRDSKAYRSAILRAVRRILAGRALWLLAISPIAAFAQYGAEPSPTAFQTGDSMAATIYPSSASCPSTAFVPPESVPQAHFVRPPMSPAAAYPSPDVFQLAAETPNVSQTQLVAFRQETVLTPPATQPMASGDMLHQMVQQDTACPDLNGMVNQPTYAPPPTCSSPACTSDYHCDPNAWHSQVLPQGIIYQSYLAGTKEPRFATWFDQNSKMGDMWDVSLGARAGIWRYGNDDPNWPEGWQLDIEGAVFPRLDPQGFSTPLIGDDYRFGIPLTYGGDRWEFKMGYYHISAHLGDEYLLYVNPAANRINYVRDSAILGAGYFFTPSIRTYGEVGYAAVDGGAKPIELQFGCEWVQARNTGARGGPFAAINADLRQEVDYGGNVSVQFGWMWRQYARGPNARIGAQYFYGKEDEYEFFTQTVSRFGWGIWYDF